jgi:putative intracellular protease/amidase
LNKGWSMRVLFVITGSDKGTWLSEVTHPFWHLSERGVEVDFVSPRGGKVGWTPRSDPYFQDSQEPDDLVSKGFLSDKKLLAKFEVTAPIKSADLDRYDAIHVAGGRGATFDLYPNKDLATALEHFWARDKLVGAICHGAIALANNGDRIRGRRVTAFSLDEDRALERQFGPGFTIPHYPQTTLQEAGAVYSTAGLHAPLVVVDGRLITGQNQQSASEYGVTLSCMLAGLNPIVEAGV